jgi:hypothetical protein
MSKVALEKIKAFGMTNQMVMDDLGRVEQMYSIDLGLCLKAKSVDEVYYPQFDHAARIEAASMSKHYETFYCLEKAIRTLVSETIETAEQTDDWWNSSRINDDLKREVAGRIQKEIDMGMTRRSSDELDYTNFGELSVIITGNWDIFGGILTSRRAVERVMASLNSLRGPIVTKVACGRLSDPAGRNVSEA